MKKIFYLLIIFALIGSVSCKKNAEQQGSNVEQKEKNAEAKKEGTAFSTYQEIMKKYEKKIQNCKSCDELKKCLEEQDVEAIEFLQKFGQNAADGLTPEQLETVKQTDKAQRELRKQKYEELCKQ